MIRADRIFPYKTSEQMRNVHLFFAKWLGCEIVESNIPVSPGIDTIAQAIIQGKPHPNIWLAFAAYPAAPLDDLHARTRAREGEFRALGAGRRRAGDY
jgi:hypothetical protein